MDVVFCELKFKTIAIGRALDFRKKSLPTSFFHAETEARGFNNSLDVTFDNFAFNIIEEKVKVLRVAGRERGDGDHQVRGILMRIYVRGRKSPVKEASFRKQIVKRTISWCLCAPHARVLIVWLRCRGEMGFPEGTQLDSCYWRLTLRQFYCISWFQVGIIPGLLRLSRKVVNLISKSFLPAASVPARRLSLRLRVERTGKNQAHCSLTACIIKRSMVHTWTMFFCRVAARR